MAFLQLKNFARNYISFPLGTYGIAIMEAVSRSQTYVKYFFVCILYANVWYLLTTIPNTLPPVSDYIHLRARKTVI